jgi:hypothetical protein
MLMGCFVFCVGFHIVVVHDFWDFSDSLYVLTLIRLYESHLFPLCFPSEQFPYTIFAIILSKRDIRLQAHARGYQERPFWYPDKDTGDNLSGILTQCIITA